MSSQPAPPQPAKHPVLVALGERVRRLRHGRGMTRRQLAQAAGVSERHLANLEYGVGNASVLILVEVARALECTLSGLLGEASGRSAAHPRASRIALIGLRGAGKSSLGSALAEDLGYEFVEISREIERLAGCSISEILALYGQNAYRRYERRALEETIATRDRGVFATPGGIVSEPANFSLLLQHFTTVWLRAEPADHMQRVVAQGDLRPMATSREAMEDLRAILTGREPFYARADLSLDTSVQDFPATFAILRQRVRGVLDLPV